VVNGKQRTLENYFKEIGEGELLTANEEIELAKRIKKNDQKALKKLVQANLRFVVSVAKSYQNKGLSLDDLINEGNVGLIKAAYRFDESRGFKFISYAVWWIRQSILQAIAEKTRTIRLPLNRISLLTKAGKVYSRLEQDHEREPTPDEIACVLQINSREIRETFKHSYHTTSLESPINENRSLLKDIIQDDQEDLRPDSRMLKESLKNEINSILRKLTSREAKILKLYYGLDGEKPHTLEEVGIIFKITRERIRQIKEKALDKLRHSSRGEVLRYYL
jgi:RNA polymerase primary sigma factor